MASLNRRAANTVLYEEILEKRAANQNIKLQAYGVNGQRSL